MNKLIILARRDETLRKFCDRPYFKNACARLRNVDGYKVLVGDRSVIPAIIRFLD